MSVELLRCRICGTEHPAVANGICSKCFGPLFSVYDWEQVAKLATRERIEAGPRSLYATACCCLRTRPRTA